jgi:lysyl-tRNA synthetase class 2
LFESEFECNLFALRKDKLRQIAALGQEPYPNQFVASHTLAEVRHTFGEVAAETLEAERPKVTVAGRLMAIRAQGKAGFAQLQQGGERLQIYVRLDAVGEQAFQLYKLLDLGDHIGVSGYMFRTRTGELTVHVETLTFLTKAMLALPEKYHGLADVELRYRQRYVDLFMNLDVRAVFVKRAMVLQAIRRFFDQRGYLEVETLPGLSAPTITRSTCHCICASRRNFTLSGWWWAGSTGSTRSIAIFVTKVSPPSTIQNSPCSSSTRRTRTITT